MIGMIADKLGNGTEVAELRARVALLEAAVNTIISNGAVPKPDWIAETGSFKALWPFLSIRDDYGLRKFGPDPRKRGVGDTSS